MIVRIRNIVLALLLAGSCTWENDNIAKNRIFYYSVTSPSDSATVLINYLSQNLNNKRVAITNQSGYSWPFYEVLGDQEELPIDSLMPPHYFVHLLKEKSNEKIKIDEFFLDIRVMVLPDTLPNYELRIFKMDSSALKLSAETGIHYLPPQDTLDLPNLYDVLLKSIVRYSFK